MAAADACRATGTRCDRTLHHRGTTSMRKEWRNWSGSLRFTPGRYAAPGDEESVKQIVESARETGAKVRPVGAGHSSSPLVRTDGTLVVTERLSGIVDHHPPAGVATVAAGTKLRDLGAGLYDAGLAMENLGDVDLQSIAGATATGTHGTGLRFGNLSTQVAGARLVTGAGDVLQVSEKQNPELLPAVRLSLGALGILTAITLKLQRHYELQRMTWCADLDWTLDHLAELQAKNRNMDFYWFPRSDETQIRTLNLREEPPDFRPPGQPRDEMTALSHHAIPRHRQLRFEEIEYMLPSEAFPECFAEVRRCIKQRHRIGVAWRVLVRTVAADDNYLSNCYRRATTTIACLQNSSLPYEEYFRDMEAVFRHYDGRPHWGKKHSLTARELRRLYPEWDAFQEIRRRLDPDGVFLTPDLARLLEDDG